MKISDKVVAAFLVSAGLFSSAHATQYVSTLSAKEKQAFVSVVLQASDGNIESSAGCDVPGTQSPH